jgi:hypothetical protein
MDHRYVFLHINILLKIWTSHRCILQTSQELNHLWQFCFHIQSHTIDLNFILQISQELRQIWQFCDHILVPMVNIYVSCFCCDCGNILPYMVWVTCDMWQSRSCDRVNWFPYMVILICVQKQKPHNVTSHTCDMWHVDSDII